VTIPKPRCFLSFFALFMTSVSAFPEKGWEQYALEPLAIIYPEDEALSNPPFIHWQGVRNASYYKIRLKGRETVSEWTTPYNFDTPGKPFAKGYYTVEVLAFDRNDKQLARSQSKNFRITKPGLDLNLQLNKITFAKGTAFVLPGSAIKAIREARGERGEYRDRALEYARQALPEVLKDFREPPRYKEGVWNFQIWQENNTLCFAIENYILHQSLAYALTGKKEFLENAKRVMLVVSEWDATGATGVWENDHSAQALLHALSVGYNVLGSELSSAEKQKVIRAITLRAEDMYRFLNPFVAKETSAGAMNDPDNNHPWFCASALGLGGIALMGETPKAEEWVAFALQMFNGVFLPRGGSEGGWHEGIDYWSYMLFFVFQFADALKTASGADLYEHPWLRHTALFKIYTHPPQGGYAPFGDCKHHAPNSFDKVIMMRLASEYNDALAWKYADAIPEKLQDNRLFYALLWSDRGGATTDTKIEIPFADHFADIGWAVSNNNVFDASRQIVFAFRSGKVFGRGFNHSHADQNSFVITAGGDRLVWDAGYYDSYLSPHHRDYSRHSVAHNTILVDGEGQAVHTKGTDGRISTFELKGRSLTVQGDASEPLIYGGKVDLFLRTIEYKDEKDFLIKDEIRLREPGRISWLVHSAYPIIYDAGKKTIRIVGEHYQLSGTFASANPVEAIVSKGFPVVPNLPSTVLDAKNVYPEQYHLELKTLDKIEVWNPVVHLILSPLHD
jgi:hypothetical protein